MVDKQTPLSLGKRTDRADAAAKVCGAERYAIDCYPEGLIWAGAKRAGVAHGIIRLIDTSDAEKIPGVLRVLTARDVPGSNRHGIIHKDTPVLADVKVRHAGDAIALVIAETREALQLALAEISAVIDPLPAVTDIDAALAPDAPLVHEERPEGNVLVRAVVHRGDAEAALSACDVVVSETFQTPMQAHAFLEVENGLARANGDGTIEMIVSTQAPFRDRFEISHALGIPFDRVKITAPYLGGGFGGKDGATVQCLLALAALAVPERWIKMVWEREESFLAGYKRHAARLEYRAGALADGTLHALSCRLVYDTGAYAHLGGEVLGLGMEHAAGPYRVSHVHIDGLAVYTNNPVAGAMRAFGVCQVSFAFEQIMDMLAEKIGMDPLVFRLRNALVMGDQNAASVQLTTSTGIVECLRKIETNQLWQQREAWKAAAPKHRKRGIGIAAVFNAMGYGKNVRDSAIAKIALTAEGVLIVTSGVADMGQGNASTFAQIAGALLGQDAARIRIVQPDTISALPSGSSSAGRTTYAYGNALVKACEELKHRIINRAGLLLFVDDDRELRLVPGGVEHAASGRMMPLDQIGSFMKPEERVSIHHFVTPVVGDLPDTGKGLAYGFPHLLFAYGAHLAAIELDLLTGGITVEHYATVTDGGKVLNPTLFEQQIEGGVAQGIGYAVMEDFAVTGGLSRTPNLSTYIIPTALDIPSMETDWVETDEASGPLGMKGVGEVAMNGPLPAIANAVADALGTRICHAPLCRDRVLAALREGAQ